MKLNWQGYWYGLVGSVLKHVGTALVGWSGINVAHATGLSVPALDFKALGILVFAAGVVPGLASFLQKQPLPDVEETVIETKTTITKTKPAEPEKVEGNDEKPAYTDIGPDGGKRVP